MSDQHGYGGYPAGEGPYEARPAREYDPYARDPFDGASSNDPYARGPGDADPYATDPLTADGYAPSFGSSAAPSGAATGPFAGGHGDAAPGYRDLRPSSGSAIAGFVVGLLAIVMCGGLTSPIGIFLSAKGMRETSPAAASPKDGRGLAIAGLVLSLVGLIPLLITLTYVVVVVVVIVTETS